MEVSEMDLFNENDQPLGLEIIRHVVNVNRAESDEARKALGLTPETAAEVTELLTACPVHAPTPLVQLPGAAGFSGVSAFYYKNESKRFTLKSFKSVGGGYATARFLARLVSEKLSKPVEIADIFDGVYSDLTEKMTLVAATSGNHGRAVAAAAKATGCKAVIMVPGSTSKIREEALAARGAEVRRVDGDYDQAAAEAERLAQQDGWHLIADTSKEMTDGPPLDVMKGYMAIANEVIEGLTSVEAASPTHVFVQGGVGALAGGVLARLENSFEERPRLIVVEPDGANCIGAAIETGHPIVLDATPTTAMTGLACREVSHTAWPVLQEVVDDALVISDNSIATIMNSLGSGEFGEKVEVGETGVASMIGALAASVDPDMRRQLAITPASRILVFGTEGATDPVVYKELTGLEPLLP